MVHVCELDHLRRKRKANYPLHYNHPLSLLHMASSNPSTGSDHSEEHHLIEHAKTHWNRLNNSLAHVPKFQNHQRSGATEEQIKALELKFNIQLPNEIRAVIKVHDGREHIEYGLGYRLPSTDLLPVSQWKPYEKDNDEFIRDLCESLTDEASPSVDRHLRDDVRDHLKVYKEDEGQALKRFESMPCELLIIGQGMDDYAEQYLLGIRSGKIYLAVHNIPEWRSIGSFVDWVNQGLSIADEQTDELKEQHEEVNVS